MKITALFSIFLIVFSIVPAVSHAQQWYEGGTLHNAGQQEWAQADAKNRLATCADFLLNTPEGRKIYEEQGMDPLKPLALKLVGHIDDALNSGKFNMNVQEAFVMSLAILKLEQRSN